MGFFSATWRKRRGSAWFVCFFSFFSMFVELATEIVPTKIVTKTFTEVGTK